jgi:hypothetical protein
MSLFRKFLKHFHLAFGGEHLLHVRLAIAEGVLLVVVALGRRLVAIGVTPSLVRYVKMVELSRISFFL